MKEEKRDLTRKVFPFLLRGQFDEMFENGEKKKVSKKYNSFEEYILKNYKTFNDLQLEYLLKSKDGKEFLANNGKVFEEIKGMTTEHCAKFATKKPLVSACKECSKQGVCKAVFEILVK